MRHHGTAATPRTLAALVFALCAAAPAAAGESPAPIRGNDRVSGEIAPAGDVDGFAIDLFPGETISVKTKTLGPVRGLLFALSMTGPSGGDVPLVVKGALTPKASFSFTATDAGTHVIVVAGGPEPLAGGVGNYEISFKVKRSKTPKGSFRDAAGGDIVHAFDVTDGSLLDIKASTPKGSLQLVELRRPDGSAEPGFGAAVTLSSNGRKAYAKVFPVTGGTGTYELRGTYAAGARAAVNVKVNRGEAPRTVRFLAEPRFDPFFDPFPSEGVAGTVINVVGTDFAVLSDGVGPDVLPGFRVGGVAVDPADVTNPNGGIFQFPAPAGLAAGQTYDILAENPDGQRALAEDAFRVVPPPAPSSMTPSDAGPAGGRSVRISGANFRSGSLVLFGGNIAQPNVVLTNRIDVRAPAHAAGVVEVVVRDEFGQETAVPGAFTYLDIGSDSIASLAPTAPQGIGGETVTVTGADFAADSVFTLDGADLATTLVSPTSVTFTMPPRAGGTSALRVTDQYEQSASLSFTVRGFTDVTSTAVPAPTSTTDRVDSWRATKVIATDANKDGIRDLVLITSSKAVAPSAALPRVRILRGNSDGTFTDRTAADMPSVTGDIDFRARDAVAFDADGDTYEDIALVTDDKVSEPAVSSLRILMNDGTGKFTDGTSSRIPAVTSYGDANQGVAIAAANFDNAGGTDLLVLHTGYFTKQTDTVTDPGDPLAVPPIPPTIVTTYEHFAGLRLLLNGGTGIFTRSTGFVPAVLDTDEQQFQGDTLAVGHADGNGRPDVFLSRTAPLEFPASSGTWVRTGRLLTNSGSAFTDATATWLPAASDPEYLHAFRAVFADADGDGDQDLLLASTGALTSPGTGTVSDASALRLLRNGGSSFTFATGVFPAKSSSDVNQCDGLAVGDLTGDGNVEIVIVSARAPDAGGYAGRILAGTGSAWTRSTAVLPSPGASDDSRGAHVLLADLGAGGGDGDLDVVIVREDSDDTARNTRILRNERQ
ncbi:MAG: hypothetical protein HMLKMBBP_02070 [Planctomycetes bacterium]|nr:hypothetical protein [Planctomycetota bacterium]